MLILDKSVQERVLAFNKYAQFISQKFHIRVVLDGVKAQTDGNTIYLPNIASLASDEVDFLYCVLLHEVGHIVYSSFSEADFKKIKTQNHFFLANAIEDARIENLLMKQYDGAHDIFDQFYNRFATDRKFMERIFGKGATDEFGALGHYVHDRILNLKHKSPLEASVGSKVASSVLRFVKAKKIDALIDRSPLKNWDDVVRLADKIYNLYFGSSRKDRSQKSDLGEMQKDVQQALKELSKGTDLSKLQDLQEKVKKQKQKLDSLKESHQPQMDDLTKKVRDTEAQMNALDDRLHAQDTIESLTQENSYLKEKIEKKESQIKDLKQELAEDPEAESAAELLKDAERIKARYEERITENDKQLSEIKKEPPLSEKEYQKQWNELDKEHDRLSSQLDKIKDKIQEQTGQVKELTEALNTEKAAQNRKIVNQLRKVQQQLDESGLNAEIIPEFEGNTGWEASDDAQKDFDDRASIETGSLVVGGKSSNTRDILTVLDAAKEKLSQIDLTKVFQAKNGLSQLDTFNVKSTKKSDQANRLESSKPHVPVTTAYDALKQLTYSDGTELAKLRVQHHADIEAVKAIFRQKFKAVKKLKYKGGQEEGSLDQRDLWKLASKSNDNYWEVTNPKFLNDTRATIAVDISGSMDQYEEQLKTIALMLSEGLSGCSVPHEVVGYHAPVCHEMRALPASEAYNRKAHRLETVVFKNFNDKSNLGIQNIKTHCADNSDGESLAFIGKRLLNEKAKRRLLFVLSDAKPYLADADVSILDEDLKKTLSWLQKNGIEVYAIGFDKQTGAFFTKACRFEKNADLVTYLRQV